jgi:rhodanese-related sulfurtransferase
MNLISIEELKQQTADGARVIDTRPSAVFIEGLIPRSFHLPHSENFLEYAELLLEPDMKLVLLTEVGKETVISRDLLKTGFANVTGIIEGGYEAWVNAGGKIDLIIDVTAEEFELDFKFDEFYLIDLRTEDQYEEEHFEYAENLPLADLEEAIPDLNPDVTYYLYGNSFEDATFAAALFKRGGFHKLRVVNEGYEALKNTGIPVTKKKKPKSDPNFSAN